MQKHSRVTSSECDKTMDNSSMLNGRWRSQRGLAAASLKPQRHGIYQGSQSAGREQGPLPGRDGWRLAFNAFPANVSYHSFLNNYLPERGGRRQNVQMHQRGNDSSSSSEGGGNPQWNLRRYQTTLPPLAFDDCHF